MYKDICPQTHKITGCSQCTSRLATEWSGSAFSLRRPTERDEVQAARSVKNCCFPFSPSSACVLVLCLNSPLRSRTCRSLTKAKWVQITDSAELADETWRISYLDSFSCRFSNNQHFSKRQKTDSFEQTRNFTYFECFPKILCGCDQPDVFSLLARTVYAYNTVNATFEQVKSSSTFQGQDDKTFHKVRETSPTRHSLWNIFNQWVTFQIKSDFLSILWTWREFPFIKEK